MVRRYLQQASLIVSDRQPHPDLPQENQDGTAQPPLSLFCAEFCYYFPDQLSVSLAL